MIRWLVLGSFAVIWTILLLLPAKEFDWAGVANWPAEVRTVVSKIVHVIAYILFACFIGWLRVPRRRRWLLLLFLVVHGIVTEIVQIAIPGRTASFRDVGINEASILVGVLISWKWWRDGSVRHVENCQPRA